MAINSSPVLTGVRHVLSLLSDALPSTSAKISMLHAQSSPAQPVVIGLTGLQGSGKSTWASSMVSVLRQEYNLNAIAVSLDDFYKTHEELVALRIADEDNKLFRTRGQPGTHDEELARSFFDAVRGQADTDKTKRGLLKIPLFDKSQFDGEGDRASEQEWPTVALPLDVIIFEGWCIGFQSIAESVVQEKQRHAVRDSGAEQISTITLADHKLEHLLQLNENLASYNATFMGPQCFDCLVHLDTNNLADVYTWRLDQESALRRWTSGQGMTDEAVVKFVRGYMPAYELYLEQLREGFFVGQKGGTRKKQIRICLDEHRAVVECAVV